MPQPLRAPGKSVELKPIRPNAGLTAKYRRKLDDMLARMQRDVLATVSRAWRDDPPEGLAQDESPAAALRRLMEGLKRNWEREFADFAAVWGRRFTTQAFGLADRGLMGALRQAGFTVRFKMSPRVQDIWTSTVSEQVNLIKSIPSALLAQVETHVNVAVQAGRDVGGLRKVLEEQFGVSRRRADLIARNQNEMATAVITRARQQEVGVTHARWLHSAGGKVPRASHLKASRDRVIYDVNKGWFDPDENKWILPGALINCRCCSISVITGIVD